MTRSLQDRVMGVVVASWLVGAAPTVADQVPGSSDAGSTVLHLVPDSSRVEYFITHPVGNVRNTAGIPSGEIHLVPTLQGWHIDGKVTVDLRTLETGINMRNRHVKSEEYLNVEAFPLAMFEFAAAEADSPTVKIETPPAGADSHVAEAETTAIKPGAPVMIVPTIPESLRLAPQRVESSLPEAQVGMTHVTETRVAEPATTPRSAEPNIDLESLPHSWRAHAIGSLTLHGVARPLDVPVELTREGDRLRVQGAFSIFLADYQIRRPSKFMLAAGKHADIRVDLLWGP